MPAYRVEWEIDTDAVDVKSTSEAALYAYHHMHKPGSTANVFIVTDKDTGDREVVDLQELWENGEVDLTGYHNDDRHYLVVGVYSADTDPNGELNTWCQTPEADTREDAIRIARETQLAALTAEAPDLAEHYRGMVDNSQIALVLNQCGFHRMLHMPFWDTQTVTTEDAA